MGKRNNSQYHKDLLKYHSGNNHMPLKKKPEEHGSLADQICEKIQGSTLETINIAPSYDIDFVSKTFGQIRLREIRDPRYTAEDIKNFFTSFDFADTVELYVDNKYVPYVDVDSIVTVTVNNKQFDLSARLMWFCLSDDVKKNFLMIKSYFKQIQGLFSAYNRKMVIRSFDQ